MAEVVDEEEPRGREPCRYLAQQLRIRLHVFKHLDRKDVSKPGRSLAVVARSSHGLDTHLPFSSKSNVLTSPVTTVTFL